MPRHLRFSLLTLLVLLATAPWSRSQGFDYEEQPSDPNAIKIVLIAGPPSAKTGEHEYRAGCQVLAKLLKQTPGVFPVLVRDGWPMKKETLSGARAIVVFHDGGDKHAFLKGERMAQVQKMVEAGVGVVGFHQAVDFPKDPGERARHWMGAVFEKGYSQRAHWVADFDRFPQHAVTRGVTPFKIDDGWLYRLRFVPDMKGITPLLRTPSPKAPAGSQTQDETIVSWLYERPDGGRSFIFTGGHLHSSWGIEGYRRLLVNGILWTAKVETPSAGAPVALDPAELTTNLEPRTAKNK